MLSGYKCISGTKWGNCEGKVIGCWGRIFLVFGYLNCMLCLYLFSRSGKSIHKHIAHAQCPRKRQHLFSVLNLMVLNLIFDHTSCSLASTLASESERGTTEC